MRSVRSAAEVGKWDEELFARFKRARGETKRALLSELLRVNLPLVKRLVGQVAGIADENTFSRRPRKAPRRVAGASDLPWEDLMQAGLQGMAHALGKFDPKRGKIAGYARWWILTNVQRLVKKDNFVKVPDHMAALPVLFAGDLSTDDGDGDEGAAPSLGRARQALREAQAGEWSGEASGDASEVLQGVTPAMLAHWERTGDWPDDLEALRRHVHAAEEAARPRVAYSVARPPIEVFLERHCIFGRRADRAPSWPLWNAWRIECAVDHRPEGSRSQFLSRIVGRGARETTMRIPGQHATGGTPVRGLSGLRAVWPSTI